MDLILSHILVLGFTFHNIADWRYKNLCSKLIVLESKKIQMAAESKPATTLATIIHLPTSEPKQEAANNVIKMINVPHKLTNSTVCNL